MSDDKQLELQLVEVEPEKEEDKLSETMKEYHILNSKCDLVISKIRERKARKKSA